MTISSDRRVLVTGGASGLGLAAARELHASGCRVALLDIDEAALEKAKSELGGVNVSTHRSMCGSLQPWRKPFGVLLPAWVGWTRWWSRPGLSIPSPWLR